MKTKNRQMTLTMLYWCLNIIIASQFAVLLLASWDFYSEYLAKDQIGSVSQHLARGIGITITLATSVGIIIAVFITIRRLFLNCIKGDIFTNKNRKLIFRIGILLLINETLRFVGIEIIIFINNNYSQIRLLIFRMMHNLPKLTLPIMIIFFSYLFKRGVSLKHEQDLTI